MEPYKQRFIELEICLANVKKETGDDFTKNALQESFKCQKCRKEFNLESDLKQHDEAKHNLNLAKCQTCALVFPKNSELEVHIKTEHVEVELFDCQECDMTFVLQWRLKKHQSIHREEMGNLRFCHFYNNDQNCPFANLGCKFKHHDAPQCKYQKLCTSKLCQFKHS